MYRINFISKHLNALASVYVWFKNKLAKMQLWSSETVSRKEHVFEMLCWWEKVVVEKFLKTIKRRKNWDKSSATPNLEVFSKGC